MTKFLILLFSFSILLMQAQDQVFLSSNQSLLNLNPSFAGSNGFIRNQTSYRTSFLDQTFHKHSALNSFDAFIKPIKAGVAFSYQYDDNPLGFFTSRTANFIYAQYLSFAKGSLKLVPSLQISHVRKQIDFFSLTFTDPNNLNGGNPLLAGNSTFPPVFTSYLSVATGMLLVYRNNVTAGFCIFNANRPAAVLLGSLWLPYRLLFHASYSKQISDYTFLQFTGRYSQQGEEKLLQLGMNAVYRKHLLAGASYLSYTNSPAFNLGYRNDFLSIVVAYDFRMSALSGNIFGFGEIHFSYNLRNKENRHPNSLLSFENW